MTKEIVVKRPTENNDNFRDISWTHSHLSWILANEFTKENHLSHIASPKICDLFAGEGGMANIFMELGWESSDITCIDLHTPDSGSELATGAKWLFWDLKRLTEAIVDNEVLPKSVLKHKNKFDLVVMAYGDLKPKLEPILTEFFAKDKNNILIIPGDRGWKYAFSGKL